MTVHSDSSLVSTASKATPDMSLLQCIHLSCRIIQLIIHCLQFFLTYIYLVLRNILSIYFVYKSCVYHSHIWYKYFAGTGLLLYNC